MDSRAGGDSGKDDFNMVRAVRKVVRTIIEAGGGDGATIKKSIDANYNLGIVMWSDARVAEWKETDGGHMLLLGAMVQHETAFTTLNTKE